MDRPRRAKSGAQANASDHRRGPRDGAGAVGCQTAGRPKGGAVVADCVRLRGLGAIRDKRLFPRQEATRVGKRPRQPQGKAEEHMMAIVQKLRAYWFEPAPAKRLALLRILV